MNGMLPMILTPLLGSEKATKFAPIISEAARKVQQGGYRNTKSDLMRAISDCGASKQQLSSLVNMLNTPMASGILNKISPGLAEGLKNIGNDICGGLDKPSAQSNRGSNQGTPQTGRANYLPLSKE